MVEYRTRIKELEEEITKTQYNKATQHHIGLLKAQIAKLKDRDEQRAKGKGKQEGFAVRKSGDATVIMVGFPSVGKSTLLNALTNADSKVAAYEFTTLNVVPGVLTHRHANIQVLDVPGILMGAARGTGRGKEVLSIIHNADCILLLIEALHPENLLVLQNELYDFKVRLNQKKPDVKIKKSSRGGITVGSTLRLTKIDKKTISTVLVELGVSNADIIVRDDISIDELIDVAEGSRLYLPGIVVVTKIDMVSSEEREKIERTYRPDIFISAQNNENIDELKDLIFERLNLIRIFCKQVGKKADLDIPLIIRSGASVEDVCRKLHKEFVHKFRFSRIWGKSAKFPGQKVGLKHILKDQDIVQISLR